MTLVYSSLHESEVLGVEIATTQNQSSEAQQWVSDWVSEYRKMIR